MQGGYAAAEHLLAHCPGLTAIFAMSDLMAVGAIRAIQDHGLRVPLRCIEENAPARHETVPFELVEGESV